MKHIQNIITIIGLTSLFSFLQFFITGIYGYIVFYPLVGILVLAYGLIETIKGV